MNEHHFQPDMTVAPDHRGDRPCALCPLPLGNAVHEVAARDPEEAVVAARIIGEGNDGDV
jgi:hypothetical protein